jgi:hypothetical protein
MMTAMYAIESGQKDALLWRANKKKTKKNNTFCPV